MNPLHALLKSATADLHDKTEKALFVNDIISNQLSRDQLGLILLAQYQFNTTLERVLRPYDWLRQEYEINNRFKTDLLRADLDELELPTPAEGHDWEINTEAGLLGACYVAEGSTLGGKVIRKHLLQSPRMEGLSHHYYSVYGTEAGPQWKRFLAFLEYHSGRFASAEVVQGARLSFEYLLQSMPVVPHGY